jgi:LmbE family N-acetylglucosaminyl deacetylase
MSPRQRRSSEPSRALVVVAHPDDAEFLCGGTVAKLCAEGWEVNYVVTTSGDMGTHDQSLSRPALAAVREKEQLAAARVLGVREVVFLRYPDGFFEDTAESRGRIVREIRRLRPDVLITWDPFRRTFTHRDHRLTGQAALDAAYPLARNHLGYPEHLLEGLQIHRVREVWLAGTAEPDYYVDVTDYFDKKIEALRRHKSQLRNAPLRELRKRVRERMQEAAKGQGFELAEAFRRLVWG